MRILLGQEEVNPDNPDNSGQPPISFAARYGHEEVVKILPIRKDVDPNKLNNSG